MADINLTTDFSQLVAMNNEVKSTDTLFVKVVDSLLREVKRANRVTKALADTTEQNLKIINAAEQITASKVQEAATKREKARQRETDRAEKDSERKRKALEKEAAAEAKLTAEIERNRAASAQASTASLNERLGVTGKPATSQGAGASALEAEVERLRMKYDQIYSASNLYESSLAELNRAHMLGVTSTKRHEAAVEQLNLEYQQFANATEGAIIANNRFSQHVNESGRNLNKFGMYAQQVGYQVGDFFVQIQSGTNVLVAFGQQATQLAGLVPGVFGAALGIGISLATALGAAWMRTSEDVEDGAKQQEDAVKSLNDTLKDYIKTREAAALGITPEEKFSKEALDKAEQDLAAANKKVQEARQVSQIAVPGAAIGGAVKSFFAGADAEEALKAQAEAQRTVNNLRSMMEDSYKRELDGLDKNYRLEVARLKLGEDSFEFKQLQAEADRRSYEDQLTANGELNSQMITGLLKTYETQQDVLKARQSELVVTQNQKSADDARAKERLAAEQEYQAAIDKTVAKNQYWSEQAKAAERQRVAVEYIVNNLSLLGAKKDAEGFNKAMEDALSAGVQFSLVDLSRIVRIAASNGWDLAASIQAAWSAATQRAPAAASVLMAGGGRPEVGIDRRAIAGAEALMVEKRRKETEAATKGGGGGAEPTESMLEKFQKQLDLEKELLGTTETYQRVRSALGEEFITTNPLIIEGLMQQAEEIKKLTRLEEDRQSIMDTVQSSFETGFMDMVKGTKTVSDAFRTMAASIIEELFRVLVVKRLVGSYDSGTGIGSGIMGAVGKAFGLASGGSMMSGQPYLVGEHGPELVVPRHSGTVVNANQTSGAMAGSGGITVQNNITVTGSDAAMVRQEVAKMIPQITNATKAAVIDAKQRGGAMAAAFR